MANQEREILKAMCTECGGETIPSQSDKKGVLVIDFMECGSCEKKTRHLVTIKWNRYSEKCV